MGVMRRMTWLTRVTLGLCLVLAVAGCGDDGGSGGDPDSDPSSQQSVETPSSSAPALVDDAAWCRGWQELVRVQGAYVATPVPEAADAVISVVGTLQALGVPESLDPSGYTELTAVLDDVRASVDPSFTPSIAPSEPADVGQGHDHGDEGQAEEEHGEAPFGTWLADHCAA
jgi:hypothetical protein